MKKVVSMKDYKLAKVVVQDLEKVLQVVDLTIQALSYYKKYGAVAQLLSALQTCRTLIEINYSKYKNILDKND